MAFGGLGRLPPSAAEALGGAAGDIAYRLGWRRSVVEDQIARAFPEREETWVRSTARASFRHVGREALSLASLLRSDPEAVRDRIEHFEGLQDLRRGLDEGRGVVIASGHFGNWELAGAAVAAFDLPIDAVMQKLKNPRLTRFIQDVRGRLGMRLINRVDAWDPMMESLAEGRAVAFVADQDARHRGVFVPFFGRPASTHRAPALLALRAGAPFFVGGVNRTGRRRYRGWAVRLDPLPGAGVKEQVSDLTRRWTAELERRIRLYPEQYFWHHRRWKTPPPGTAPAESGMMSGVGG